MEEFIQKLHECAVALHDAHIAVRDVPVHEKLGEWYDKMLKDYDSFREWGKIFDCDLSHSVSVSMADDTDVDTAFGNVRSLISEMLEIAVVNIPDGYSPEQCGLRSDIEALCSYWSKVAYYSMR